MGLFKRKHPQVIDLRDRVVAPPAPAAFEFGFPTRCPECGSRGYLDHIDPFKRVQFEHCPSCWAKWETSEEELLAAQG